MSVSNWPVNSPDSMMDDSDRSQAAPPVVQNKTTATQDEDTVAAIATPPGVGGVGIVRVTGARAANIAREILGTCPPPRSASFRSFMSASGEVIDQGIALWFPAPGSFTGEDVLELQAHGGPVLMDMLLRRVLNCGARLARPGEFTERAFLNNKLDLVQAEAVADLITSVTEAAARGAQKSLCGAFSEAIRDLESKLMALRVYVEAAIDFPEEEVDYLLEGEVMARVGELKAQLDQLQRNTRTGVLLREGIRLVLAGKPNVGKSSLLNRLAGHDRAIVTAVPGTTRDTILETLDLGGLAVEIVDTAGLREATDAIEREGVSRTLKEVAVADLVLLLTDAPPGTESLCQEAQKLEKSLLSTQTVPNDRFIFVRNKTDLHTGKYGLETEPSCCWVNISALTGAGLETLIERIRTHAGFSAVPGMFTARERHLIALQQADRALQRGEAQLLAGSHGELLAEDLKLAHRALGAILGEVSSDELLGEIFSSFCIGK